MQTPMIITKAKAYNTKTQNPKPQNEIKILKPPNQKILTINIRPKGDIRVKTLEY
jgi:hypothetical protein